MANAERILEALGAVPAGVHPKTIIEEGGKPGYYQTDPLSNLVRTLKKRQLEIDDALKKKQEQAQKKVDMYKTLREAGYDPKSAYEAVSKVELTPPGPEDTSLKKTTREKILDKIAKGEILLAGEQRIYDETIKHKETETLDEAIGKKEDVGETDNQKALREQILDKIARGQPLTPGEQKIYDEVIKKGSTKSPDTLDSALVDELVPVTNPEGKKGFIKKSKLEAALKAGYKKR